MDLKKLDSMSKYPSIRTFHVLGERRRLMPALTIPGQKLVEAAAVSVTEKINGMNARIVLTLGDWYLGSRDNLVMDGDMLISNQVQDDIERLAPVAERLFYTLPREDGLVIIYGELYGGTIGHDAKNYARDGSVGFRVFDIRTLTISDYSQVMAMPVEKIAHMRDAGVLPGHWLSDTERKEFCREWGLDDVPLLPSMVPPPSELASTYEWLKKIVGEKTRAALGSNEPGRPEGVVVRTPDRLAIAKLRIEDYERTLKISR